MLTKDEYRIAILAVDELLLRACDALMIVLKDIDNMDEDMLKMIKVNIDCLNTNQQYNYDNTKESIMMRLERRINYLKEKKLEENTNTLIKTNNNEEGENNNE